MEEVLDTYALPYDAEYPLVCLDEKTVQLLDHVHPPRPAVPGIPARIDHEYQRCGTANLFIEFEPLTGQRTVTVTERRTSQDFAARLQAVDKRYLGARKIRLVLDQLSTHTPASLYESLPAAEANRLTKRFELIYTPKHASWLNMAEMEWSVLERQCLDRRISTFQMLEAEVSAWEGHRNANSVMVNWQFTTQKAREKMGRQYKAQI